ncbi:hypothetical protein H257_14307 [Aphanomyces astaci]|uniref:Uncharacterized protein n=1 Tax=Aphanomyces astaci TaxID=112090 RepID=W4FRM6_APHAT|nr:hypothetical protein H257_14307 [Aphanomyces astaci]ETV70145.1 hypothetical protein H257_14307 [Aphanomyces astaci]|eukprot:XP_009840376.1 hypothetical protein H257_14307 [Aphanomyces astaci]
MLVGGGGAGQTRQVPQASRHDALAARAASHVAVLGEKDVRIGRHERGRRMQLVVVIFAVLDDLARLVVGDGTSMRVVQRWLLGRRKLPHFHGKHHAKEHAPEPNRRPEVKLGCVGPVMISWLHHLRSGYRFSDRWECRGRIGPD